MEVRYLSLSQLFPAEKNCHPPSCRRSSFEQFRLNPRFAKSVRARWICSAHTLEYLAANDAAVSRYGPAIDASLLCGPDAFDTSSRDYEHAGPAVWRLRFACGLSTDVDVRVSSTIALADRDVRVVLDSGAPMLSGSDGFDQGKVDMTGQCVLVVDDNEALGRMFCRMLEARGYKALSASGAFEAWTLMSESPVPVDLLLTDVQMPGMGGFELSQLIQAQWPWIRVLYMSADPDAIRHQLTGLGSTGILLPKPFTSLELVEAVQRALQQTTS